jgi:hypothetical protein
LAHEPAALSHCGGRILTLPPPLVLLHCSQPGGSVVFSLSAIPNGGEGRGEVGLQKPPMATKPGPGQAAPHFGRRAHFCWAAGRVSGIKGA